MNIFWVIQGHTKYVDVIVKNFAHVKNVIWCTEEDSPKEHLDIIKKSNIQLLTIKRSPDSYGRLLIHSNSATAGIKEAKKQNADYIIKLRSDLIFSDHEKFMKIMRFDNKIYGNAYVKHKGRFIEVPQVIADTYAWLYQFRNKLYDFDSLNYITDWIHYGPTDELLLFYENVFKDNLQASVICEVRFITSYLLNKNLPLDFSYNELTKNIGLFMGDLYDNNITMFSLKENYDYSRMWDSSYGLKAVPEAYLK